MLFSAAQGTIWGPLLGPGNLSPRGPNEEQKEGEQEKGSQDRDGCVHPRKQGD